MYKVEVVSWNLKPNCLPIVKQTGYAMICIQIEDSWQKTEKWLNDNAFLKIFFQGYIYIWSCCHAYFFWYHVFLPSWTLNPLELWTQIHSVLCKFSLLWCFFHRDRKVTNIVISYLYYFESVTSSLKFSIFLLHVWE